MSRAIRLAEGLGFAATPCFAGLALLAASGGGAVDVCGGTGSPLLGMAPMYGLMAVFHARPWLRLAAARRGGAAAVAASP